MRQKSLIVLTVFALVATSISGCGEPARTNSDDGRKLTITMVDYRYQPQNLQTKAGKVRLTLFNRGRQNHNLKLVSSKGRIPLKVPVVKPGERTVVESNLEPGRYRMYSTIGNQKQLGMYGSIVVQ